MTWPRIEIDQRRGQEDQPRKRVEKVRHRVEVAEPLRRLQSLGKERVVRAHDLDHAAGPADALLDVSAEALRRQSGRLRDVDVGRVPAIHLHAQRGVRVLSHGLDRDAANLIESGAAKDRAGAAEERRVPEVVAVLNDAVEELALVRNDAELAQIALERIGRIEVVGRLQHPQLAVAQKPPERDLHEAARGDVVAIEDGDEGERRAGLARD